MEKQLKSVEEFHNAFGVKNEKKPTLIAQEIGMLRHNLMKEENDEYLDAVVAKDLTGIADALGDELYILCGTILAHGMQHVIEDVFNEIHSSNMSKLGEDGKPIYRADGKVLKGANYFKPDLSKFL
jgi:predicted HAD superfamily Cof-like phosphohydrolase